MGREYSEEFKKRVVEKSFSSRSIRVKALARELGIPSSTLRGWRKSYSLRKIMEESDKHKPVRDWSPEEKLKAIIQTSTMSEHELGKYLRSNGLHVFTIESWKQDCLSNLKIVERPKVSEEVKGLRKDKKSLEKNLNRKDKALAEMSARIIFLKKSHLIFGGNEEDELMNL